MKLRILAMLLTGALVKGPLTLNAAGLDKAAGGAAQECRLITASLGRLSCYDQYFPPPLKIIRESVGQSTKTWNTSQHKQVVFLRRHIDSIGLFESFKDLHFSNHKGLDPRIVVAVAAQPSTASQASLGTRRPVLLFQCYQDISSMQLLWTDNLDTGKADVRIWGGDQLLIDTTWRAMDEAFLLSSPHGLPGIKMIKQLFGYPEIKVQVIVEQQQYSATFTIDKLKQIIKPLGEHCSWL